MAGKEFANTGEIVGWWCHKHHQPR
jgi:hypothetical protein